MKPIVFFVACLLASTSCETGRQTEEPKAVLRPAPTYGKPVRISAVLSTRNSNNWGIDSVRALVNGQEKFVASHADRTWLVLDSTALAYSDGHGSGGFENEGQGLHLYNAETGETRQVLSEYYMIDTVWSETLSNGATPLLVVMSDGGLGAERFAVVDPARGEVFFRSMCRVHSIEDDRVTLAFYTAEDWEKLVGGVFEVGDTIRPHNVQTVDLKWAVTRGVIQNKREN